MLSERVSKIEQSKTLEIDSKVKFLTQKGEHIINLSVGEPPFHTPRNVKEAAIDSINQNFTKYTQSSGILELRQAISNKLKTDNNLDYSPDEIVVSCGAKHSLINSLLSLLNPGDEALIPLPYWTSYPEQVKICNASPVLIETEDFKLNSEVLERSITPKTKVLFLNSPNNPTGMIYTKKELEDIADIVIKHKIYVLSDEIYEKIIYEDDHISIASLNDEIKDLTVTINGVSKSYAMTGWRIGYLAANQDVSKAVSKIQSHSTSNPNSIAQKAALEALKGDQTDIKELRLTFKKRRDLMYRRIKEVSNITCMKPKGAFYIFPEVSGLFNDKIDNSTKLCNYILESAKVAAVPGIAFGSDNHIRLSYATSREKIEKAMDRITKILK